MTQQWKLVPVEPTEEMWEAYWERAKHPISDYEFPRAIYRAMLAAAPTPPASAQDDAKEAVMDAIADALGNAYDCMRVWSAWGVGTMSQDDFRLVADDAGRLGELADAAIAAMRPAPAAGDARDDQTRWNLRWIMREADAAKETCSTDPESPAAIRNAGEAAYYAVMHGQALYGIFDSEAAAEACKEQGHPDAPFSVKPLYAAPQASECECARRSKAVADSEAKL